MAKRSIRRRAAPPQPPERRTIDQVVVGVFAVLAATVFASHAPDVAQWAVCGNAAKCEPSDLFEALATAALVTTAVGLAGTALARKAADLTRPERAIAILIVLANGAFALLKAADTAVKATQQQPEGAIAPAWLLLREPMLMLALIVLVVAVPLVAMPRSKDKEVDRLLAHTVAALLAGVVAGGLLQLILDIATGFGSSEFLIKPWATVIAGATLSVAILDPLLAAPHAPTPRERLRVALLVVVAFALAAIYATAYWPDDDRDRQSLSPMLQTVVVALLMLPGIVASTACVLIGRARRITFFRAVAVAFTLGAGAAAAAHAISGAPADTAAFILAHALANTLVAALVALTPAMIAFPSRS